MRTQIENPQAFDLVSNEGAGKPLLGVCITRHSSELVEVFIEDKPTIKTLVGHDPFETHINRGPADGDFPAPIEYLRVGLGTYMFEYNGPSSCVFRIKPDEAGLFRSFFSPKVSMEMERHPQNSKWGCSITTKDLGFNHMLYSFGVERGRRTMRPILHVGPGYLHIDFAHRLPMRSSRLRKVRNLVSA